MDLTRIDAPEKGNFLVSFADIEGFLGISTSLSDPIELFDLLNGVAAVASECVAQTTGTIVKFIGDACLSVFPEDAVDAGILCLLDLKKRTEALLSRRGFKNRLRISAHFGEAAIGQFGRAPDRRLDIFGQSVNVASGLGRGDHRGRLIISPQAFRKLSTESRRIFHKYTPPIVYVAEA